MRAAPLCIYGINKSMKLSVRVIPKAKQEKVEHLFDNAYKVWVTATPENGKANKAVIEALAEFLDVKKNCLTIVAGLTSKEKVIERSEL